MSKDKEVNDIELRYFLIFFLIHLLTASSAVGMYVVISGDYSDIVLTLPVIVAVSLLSSLVMSHIISQPILTMRQKLLDIKSLKQVGNLELGKLDSPEHVASSVSLALDNISETSTDKLNKIKRSENFLDSLINQINVGVVVLDKDNNIQMYNDAAESIIGLEAETKIDSKVSDALTLKLYGELFLEKWLNAKDNQTSSAAGHWRDVELTDAQNKTKYLELIVQHYGEDPDNLHTILLLIDRTEEQTLEDQKVDFIAIAAHELRAPITILSGYLQVFEDELNSKLNKEQQSFLKKMRVSSEQLASFINNILHVSKIEQGDININQVETDINKLIKDNQEVLELRAETHNKQLTFSFGKNLPTIPADANILPTVVSNLVGNAIKYTNKDGKINLITQYNENTKEIEVLIKDNGIGIPSSSIGNMFTKFYRSHRSKNQFGGSGIGLYLCKSIIDAHGGKIWVDSKEGEGSTFGFSLPTWENFGNQDGDKESKVITRTHHGWIKNHSMYRG